MQPSCIRADPARAFGLIPVPVTIAAPLAAASFTKLRRFIFFISPSVYACCLS
jgi:hypothetical protein